MAVLNRIVLATLVLATVNAFSGESLAAEKDDKMGFVFELVRHGARAPIEDRGLDQYPVSAEQLTPEGMRHRFLLGRFNRERYTNEY